jgi:hypothetical protein
MPIHHQLTQLAVLLCVGALSSCESSPSVRDDDSFLLPPDRSPTPHQRARMASLQDRGPAAPLREAVELTTPAEASTSPQKPYRGGGTAPVFPLDDPPPPLGELEEPTPAVPPPSGL